MLHVVAHILVPAAVVAVFYGRRWVLAGTVLLATMLVDLDHLVAEPIYDPARCSIGFHPLQTVPAIVVHARLAVLPLGWWRSPLDGDLPRAVLVAHLAGVGLVLHMALDLADCLF